MTLVDSSVWLALAFRDHLSHEAASLWFAQQSSGDLAFCRQTQISYLRLMTTTAVSAAYGVRPLSNSSALAEYRSLLDDPRTCFVAEPGGTNEVFLEIAGSDSSSPNVWMDAYLAAFAIAGGYRFATFDRGFRRYERLDLIVL